MFGNYYSPFDFDVTEDGDGVVIDKNSLNFNADKFAKQLIDVAKERKDCVRSNDVFIQWGGDFRWMNGF